MDKHTSKARVADTNLAAAALMNASGTGSSLFVINLCASMAPVPNVGKSLPGLDTYRLYQVARREDGRTRYRLRLGFFTSEADAEAVLNTVRDSYPTAFTACLCDEDRKFARGFAPESSAPPAPPKIAVVESKAPAKPASPSTAPKPAVVAPAKPVAAAPKAAPTPTPTPQTQTPLPRAAKAPTPPAPVEIELSWEPPQLQTQPSTPDAPAAHVVSTTSKTPQVIKAAPVAAPTAAVVTPAAPVATKAAPAAPAAKKPAAQTKSPPPATIDAPAKLRAAIELSLESEPTPAPAPQASERAPATEPFRVSKGVDLPTTSLSLESTNKMRAITPPAASSAAAKPAAKPATPVTAAAPTQSTSETSKMRAAQAAAPAAIKAAASSPLANLPELDSTQTIRALTSDELQDESQEKWFAIQLAVSDQPVNLEAMPRLDIFEAYRLYSVASAGSGKITHSLRIGFFREEVSAEAVSGYLKTFFASPSVVRISIAEQARFKDAPMPKQKPAAKAEVLDLSHARERTSKPVPTVTMEVETPRFDPLATGSFKASSSGAHQALASATGAHKALASSTGVHKALASSTGAHRALGATGTHKALKVASKSSPPPTKRSSPTSKMSATGKHKALQPKKSLNEQLLDEAREVELSASGIRKLPKNDSLLSKMFGKLTKS